MAGAQLLAGFHGQQSFAGNTNPNQAARQPGTPAEPTITETLHLAGIRSDIDSLLAGGSHPESTILQPASRALETAEGQFRGPHGGAVPQPGSAASPGPAGEAIAVRGRGAIQKLGTFLGVRGG